MAWTRAQVEEVCAVGKKTGKAANFRGLKLYEADFSGLDLEKADFRSCSCPYSNFENANCKFMNGEGGNFTFTKWQGANLHRANFKDASLCEADMRGVKDFFGITMTMECNAWKGLKLDPGFYYGFLFYGLLMEPPDQIVKDKLISFFGPERFTVLKELYASRRM
jgi:uncharacterized protein YjbI with pentapeptide repeats